MTDKEKDEILRIKAKAAQNGYTFNENSQTFEIGGNTYTLNSLEQEGIPDRTKANVQGGFDRVAERTQNLFNLKARGEELKGQADQESAQAKFNAAKIAERRAFTTGISTNLTQIGAGLAGVEINQGDMATKAHEELALLAIEQGANLEEANAFAKLAMETSGITRAEGELQGETLRQEGEVKQQEIDIAFEDNFIADQQKYIADYNIRKELELARDLQYFNLNREIEFKDEERARATELYNYNKEFILPLQLRALEQDVAKNDLIIEGTMDVSGKRIVGGSPVVSEGFTTSTLRDAGLKATSVLDAMQLMLDTGINLEEVLVDGKIYFEEEKQKSAYMDWQTQYIRMFTPFIIGNNSPIESAIKLMYKKNGGPVDTNEQELINTYGQLAVYAAIAKIARDDIGNTDISPALFRFFYKDIGSGNTTSIATAFKSMFDISKYGDIPIETTAPPSPQSGDPDAPEGDPDIDDYDIIDEINNPVDEQRVSEKIDQAYNELGLDPTLDYDNPSVRRTELERIRIQLKETQYQRNREYDKETHEKLQAQNRALENGGSKKEIIEQADILNHRSATDIDTKKQNDAMKNVAKRLFNIE